MTHFQTKDSITRPPIVVVMGHVDHGKTTLLDYIRKTNVAAKEIGGITQSIGAYEIIYHGKKITFIDTPGHEAFSKMRERGAQVADLAILVVAADDGVKPQTKDALEHIKKAGIPFVVAINKIDKSNADIEKTKSDLRDVGVFLEGEGGDISWQAISAKKGEGVNELLDLILLVAEMEELKYEPEGEPRGLILTARLDQRRGLVVGGIVKNGRLARNQFIATLSASGKIKILENFLGEPADFLVPSAPALIIGFEKLPLVGEEFLAGDSLDKIIGVLKPVPKTEVVPKITAEKSTGIFKVILRADEVGSLEALSALIEKINAEFPLTVVDADVGNINESDVKLADSVKAIIIGFKTKIDKPAENFLKNQQLTVINSDIIYDLEKSLRIILETKSDNIKNELEVLAVFGKRKGQEQVVGGRVLNGIIKRGAEFEIVSGTTVIGGGRVLNLQVQKQDVNEAVAGQEAGLLVETDLPIEIGYKFVFK